MSEVRTRSKEVTTGKKQRHLARGTKRESESLKRKRRNEMRRMKAFALLVVGLSLVGSLAFGQQWKGVTISVANPIGWTQTMPFKDNVGDFEKKTGIKVAWRDLGFDVLESKGLLAGSGKTGEYDVFMYFWQNVPRFGEYSISLNDFIKKDYGSVDQWKKGIYERITRDMQDEVKFVAFHFNAQFGLYRKALFEDPKEKAAFKAKFGYELAPPKDFKQLIDIARFFTRDTNGDGKTDLWGIIPTAGPTNVEWLFSDWAYLHRVDFFMADGRIPFKSGVDNKNAVLVATYLHDLVYKYKAMPPDIGTTTFAEVASLWKEGKAAMSYGYWGDYWRSFAKPEVEGKIGKTGSFYLTPVPNPYDHGGYGVYAISKECKNPAAAWEYIKWATSTEIALKVADFAGLPPAKIADGKLAVEKGFIAPALEVNLGRLKGAPTIPEMNPIFATFGPTLGELMANMISPEQAVTKLVNSTEEILKKGGYIQ
jgi:multiple sugar transport system substrate-binding protein